MPIGFGSIKHKMKMKYNSVELRQKHQKLNIEKLEKALILR